MECIVTNTRIVNNNMILCFQACLFSLLFTSLNVHAATRMYNFQVEKTQVTRLCHTKNILTVNGQYPGPAIVAQEGDQVVIRLTNKVSNNVTIHWHGVRQLRSAWADGPAYITQCPVQTGKSYVYNFTVHGQTGTLFWHAHISWLRATLYGPIIILPNATSSYPFPKPDGELTLLLGEWWKSDTERVIKDALRTGGAPNVSDSFTINGLPGPLYNCSNKNDTMIVKVKPGKRYMLRIINAALNEELFFSIANHTMQVVEVDSTYVKPFSTESILLTPGQTTNVLVTAHSKPPPKGTVYLIEARPYITGSGPHDNSTTAAILQYDSSTSSNMSTRVRATLPGLRDTSFATTFGKKLRSLGTPPVPKKVDKKFLFTVGLGLNPCNAKSNATCQAPNGTRFTASINNISFSLPSVSILQAYYFRQNKGVFATNFPDNPPMKFDYTGMLPQNMSTAARKGTKVKVVPFNSKIELVMQDTSIVTLESHPLHLHGNNFFVVGQGVGNYDPKNDPKKFNLVDPVERNTVGVPSGGWVAVRWKADNPGVWFMHCHLEVHTTWGLEMAWIVLNGNHGASQTLLPPPPDLPPC